MSKYRIERINETIKEVLSEIVLNDIKDPRVGLVTIVSVKVAKDLATAQVHSVCSVTRSSAMRR